MRTPRALRITQHRYQLGEANRDAVLGDRPDKVEDADIIAFVPLAPELAVPEQVIVHDHDRRGHNEPDKTKVFGNTVAKKVCTCCNLMCPIFFSYVIVSLGMPLAPSVSTT